MYYDVMCPDTGVKSQNRKIANHCAFNVVCECLKRTKMRLMWKNHPDMGDVRRRKMGTTRGLPTWSRKVVLFSPMGA